MRPSKFKIFVALFAVSLLSKLAFNFVATRNLKVSKQRQTIPGKLVSNGKLDEFIQIIDIFNDIELNELPNLNRLMNKMVERAEILNGIRRLVDKMV